MKTPQSKDIVAWFVLFLAGSADTMVFSAPAKACAGLDAEAKKALRYLIDDASGNGTAGREDNEEVRWATRTLLNRGQKVLPCLVDIYRHGQSTGESLADGDQTPPSGKWTITLIRQIDPKTAVPLYRELRSQTDDPLTRVQMDAELAILGDSQFLQDIVDFLDNPPELSSESPGDVTYVQDRALTAILVQDHKAALPILKKLASSFPYKPLIRVYIAQLSRDIASIEKYTQDPRMTIPAILALKRMGRVETLKEIADDPSNTARTSAQAVLSGTIGP